MYLMNYLNQIIHYDRENDIAYNVNLEDGINLNDCIKVEHFVDTKNREKRYIYNIDIDQNISKKIKFPTVGEVTLTYNPKNQYYTISNDNKQYLTCFDTGYSFGTEHPSLWEHFFVVDDALIKQILYIKSQKWVSQRTGKLYSGDEVTFEPGFFIKIGDFLVDFKQISCFSLYKFIGICDGWIPEVFLLYRPLVYITAYSSEHVLEQLKYCINSLRTMGQYHEKIIVMTDKNQDYINNLCQDDSANVDIDQRFPTDFLGYVCSKYDIHDCEQYKGYQPIMYLDPDIIFNIPVENMLVDATIAKRICAPIEKFSYLSSHVPIGAGLMQLDSIKSSEYGVGFNGGTIIIPNVEDHETREIFFIAMKTITNSGYFFGRHHNKWADQEVINYVSVKFANIDTHAISKYAKFKQDDPYVSYNLTGFVHFWANPGHVKASVMKTYLEKLYDVYKISKKLM